MSKTLLTMPVLTMSYNNTRGSETDFGRLLSLQLTLGIITDMVILIFFLSVKETADNFRQKTQ